MCRIVGSGRLPVAALISDPAQSLTSELAGKNQLPLLEGGFLRFWS
jgi:hypothetical protein